MSVRTHDAMLALALALSSVALPSAALPTPCAAQDGDARTRALELFQQSAERYRDGRFDEAAALLREARRLHPEPVLSYNLARALEGSGDLAGAVAAYRDYLDEAPDAADAPATRARLAGLERHLAEIRAVEEERERLRQEQAERARVAPPIAPPARGPDAAPWIVAGVGAGALVAGAIVGGLALARNDDAQRAPTHAAAVEAAGEASDLATAANVTLIAAGVLALAGGIWGTIDLVTLPREASSGETQGGTVTLRLGLGSLAIAGTL